MSAASLHRSRQRTALTHWRSEYEADLQVSLASLAGERLFFKGDNSSGVGGDLGNSTRLATMMVGYWGMGETVSSHGIQRQFGTGGGRKRGGDDDETEQKLLEGGLGQQIENKLTSMLDRVELLLTEYRQEVLAVTHALEQHKTLTGDDVNAIIDGERGPFVDGRVYHTPEAIDALEEYHEIAAKAHREGTDVPEPLPVLDAQVLEALPVGSDGEYVEGMSAEE